MYNENAEDMVRGFIEQIIKTLEKNIAEGKPNDETMAEVRRMVSDMNIQFAESCLVAESRLEYIRQLAEQQRRYERDKGDNEKILS